MRQLGRYPCVLSIYPNTRGFAFVVFERSLSPIDWGIKHVRRPQKNAGCVAKARSIIERYRPSILILQDTFSDGVRRSRRIRQLNESIAELAAADEIPVCAYTRDEVVAAFSGFGIRNKRDVALVIARNIPAFERYVPPPRRPWMSEDDRMGLFDAAALALTFFKTPEDKK